MTALADLFQLRQRIRHTAVALSAGAGAVVAAVPGKRIVVTSLVVTADDDATLKFTSGVSGTDLTGAMSLYSTATVAVASLARSSTGALVMPEQLTGWLETASGEALAATVTGGNINGVLSYMED